ncbi:MAG: hypothetical protein HC893_02990 [Chloroflexaceae bacterium]|nr:hypothetical protein [Chloroflexaceae bacterium]
MNRRLIEKLRAIEKRLVEVDQRLARVVLHGKVSDLRQQGGDWQVRLEIGRDPETDAVVKSPWVPVQPAASGALKIKVKPTVGERMTMLSPSGTVGTGSWAIRGPFDDDHPPPAGDEDVVLEVGATRIIARDGLIALKVGATEIEMTDGAINVVADNIHHVGKTHLGVDGKGEAAIPKVVTTDGPAKKTQAKV